MQRSGLCIALLGAESTGKSQLTLDLEQALNAWCIQGFSVTVVPEVLREWCELKGCVPTQAEQWQVARAQEHRVQQAAAVNDLVIADTTSLMTAIYSEHVYADASLYSFAKEQQANYALHLVTGLDMAWVADGIQRDGPHVREHVDNRIRHHLQDWGLPHQTIWGLGQSRIQNALQALKPVLAQRFPDQFDHALALSDGNPNRNQDLQWTWLCERCSDGSCEHQLFRRLTGAG